MTKKPFSRNPRQKPFELSNLCSSDQPCHTFAFQHVLIDGENSYSYLLRKICTFSKELKENVLSQSCNTLVRKRTYVVRKFATLNGDVCVITAIEEISNFIFGK